MSNLIFILSRRYLLSQNNVQLVLGTAGIYLAPGLIVASDFTLFMKPRVKRQ